MSLKTIYISIATLLLVGCSGVAVVPVVLPVPGLPDAAITPDPDLQAFAKTVLNDLQPASIAEQREYCGYIYRDANGALASTAAQSGTLDACDYGFAPTTTVASFHTHGNHLPAYDSEIPSVDDALASVDTGISDFLVTPGGRLWWIGADGVSVQLCGENCMVADATYAPDPALPVDSRYSLRELQAIQN